MEARLKGKVVVVSAVNFSEGGPLTVLRDCLDAASKVLGAEWQIFALVHDCALITNERIRCIAYPKSKGSWRVRLGLEFRHFHRLSLRLEPTLWLSLHDVTPSVVAQRRVVYCHNPAPFYRPTLAEAWLEPKLLLFSVLYKYLYRMNIHHNRHVVVQQEWIREAFGKLYGHRSVIVARPESAPIPMQRRTAMQMRTADPSGKFVFFYPALARVFKNFEVLCRAVESMASPVRDRIELRLTIDGTENKYARRLVRRFAGISAIRFIGRQESTEMERLYAECHAVLFPSKLETWGLPISEAKSMGKPLLLADLAYAREAVGEYELVSFLPASNVIAWQTAMSELLAGTWVPAGNLGSPPRMPYAADWAQLWSLITADL